MTGAGHHGTHTEGFLFLAWTSRSPGGGIPKPSIKRCVKCSHLKHDLRSFQQRYLEEIAFSSVLLGHKI